MDSESKPNQSNRTLNAAPYLSFRIGTIPDYPTDDCEILMDYLGWSYEFVMGNDNGVLNSTDPLSSTDMVCVSTMMSSVNWAHYSYTYPVTGSLKQIYLYQNTADPMHRFASIGRPFTVNLWLAVLISVIITIITFFIMQVVIAKIMLFPTIGKSLSLWTEISLRIDLGIHRELLTNFVSIRIASILWLILWGPVILQLYQANVKTYLTVPDTMKLPFTDFDSLIQQLRSGTYRLLMYGSYLPQCPGSIGTDEDCVKIFDAILETHPAMHAEFKDVEMMDELTNITNMVAYGIYEDYAIPATVSQLIGGKIPYKAQVMVIRNEQVSLRPAGYPLRSGFPYRKQLNSAVIALQLAVKTAEMFEVGKLFVPLQFDPIPLRSSFQLYQLVSVFQLLGIGLGLSLCVFLVEILMYCKALRDIFAKIIRINSFVD